MKGKKGKGQFSEGGVKRTNPAGQDRSGWATTKGGSVDDAAVRKSTAPTPRSLGPRTA